MDPNIALDQARTALRHFAHHAGQKPSPETQEAALDAAAALAERFGDLDEWLTGQGFLPRAWQR